MKYNEQNASQGWVWQNLSPLFVILAGTCILLKKRIGRLQLKMTFCGNFRIQTPRLPANLSSTNDRQVQPGLRANQVLERILQPITRKYIRTVQ